MMNDKIKVVVIGGGGVDSLALMAAIGANNIVVVDNDNAELRHEDREEFYISAPPKIKPAVTLPSNSKFIQQKMQGKRRTY